MLEKTRAKSLGIRWFSLAAAFFISHGLPAAHANTAEETATHESRNRNHERPGILWRDPVNLGSRDLFFGEGGKQHAPPKAGYTFVKEDPDGSAPKFVVEDSNGVRWKVKLGPESRGEVAATRLVWAAGYFTDEDYYLDRLEIKDMPRLRRGQDLVFPPSVVRRVRMEREIVGQKKVGHWKWKGEHWTNPRAFNGLKVLMAVINNWDLKNNNTAIYGRQTRGSDMEYVYAVSDLGASFGRTHLDRLETKSYLEYYGTSEFITRQHPGNVDFATPGAPTFYLLFNPWDYWQRRRLTSITGDVDRADAQWIGQILARLSRKQIRDAFLAGGFSQEESDEFTSVVEQRVRLLEKL